MFPRKGLFNKFSTATPTLNTYNIGDVAANYGYGIRFNYTPSVSTDRSFLSNIVVENISAVGSPEVRGELHYWTPSGGGAYVKMAETPWETFTSTTNGLYLQFKNSPTTLVTDPEPLTGPVPLWTTNFLGPQRYLVIIRTKSISVTDYLTLPYTSAADSSIEDSSTVNNNCNLRYLNFVRTDSTLTETILSPTDVPLLSLYTDDVRDDVFISAMPSYDIVGNLTDTARKILPYTVMDYARIVSDGFAVGSGGFVNSAPQKATEIDPSDTDLIARRFPTKYTSTPVESQDLATISPISFPVTGTVSLTCKLGAQDYNSVVGEVGIWAKLTYWDSVTYPAGPFATVGVNLNEYFLLAIAHTPAIVKSNNDVVNLNVVVAF